MLTHAIQSDIVMICARVMQRKKSDKNKKGFLQSFITLRHQLRFDLFLHSTVIIIFSFHFQEHMVNSFIVFQIFYLVSEHFLNWCVPYVEWACIDSIIEMEKSSKLIYKT